MKDKVFDKMLKKRNALYYLPNGVQTEKKELIREEPLAINIQGKTHAVVMREWKKSFQPGFL